MRIVELIRAKYGEPRRISEAKDEPCYCVGGAICLYAGLTVANARTIFPNRIRVAEAIQKLNPRVAIQAALGAAVNITMANDLGCFESAWHYADGILGEVLENQTT